MIRYNETYYRRAKSRLSRERASPRQAFQNELRGYEETAEELVDRNLKTWASDSSQYKANLLPEYAYLHLKQGDSVTTEDLKMCSIGISALHERQKKKFDSNDLFLEMHLKGIIEKGNGSRDLLDPLSYRFKEGRHYPLKADIYRNSSNEIETVVFYRKSRYDDYLSFFLCTDDFFGYAYSYAVTCSDSLGNEPDQSIRISSLSGLNRVRRQLCKRKYHALIDAVPVKVPRNYIAEAKNEAFEAASLLASFSQIIHENGLSVSIAGNCGKCSDLEGTIDLQYDGNTIRIIPIVREREVWLCVEKTTDYNSLLHKGLKLRIEDGNGNSVDIIGMYAERYRNSPLRLSWLECFSADID